MVDAEKSLYRSTFPILVQSIFVGVTDIRILKVEVSVYLKGFKSLIWRLK